MAAIEIDPSQACVWKNLGSVHEKLESLPDALECYEKTLTLDPANPEALLAKGILLIKNGADPAAGATIIADVLNRDDTARAHWGPAWYWAALGFYRGDRALDALRLLEDALAHMPNHGGLLNLKAHILAERWQEEAALQREAEGFFTYRAEVSPKDFRPIEALGRIYLATGRSDELCDLLARFFHDTWRPGIWRTMGGASEDFLAALHHLEVYKRFRGQHPIGDYAQLFSDARYPLSADQREALHCSLAEPFGLAFREIYDADPRDEAAYAATFEKQLGRVRSAITRWVSHVASEIGDCPNHTLIDILASLAIACARTALLESSRTMGTLVGFFGLPVDQKTGPMPESIETLEKDVAVDVLRAFNDKVKLVPDT